MNFNSLMLYNLSKSALFYKINLSGTRSINSCLCLTNKTATFRQGKTFNKLLGFNSKKKKYYVGSSYIAETPVMPGTAAKKVGGGKDSSRRIAVLNKLFMTHITELMATGNAASIISGLNIIISRVSMCPTFTQINAYWLAQGGENDKIVEARLLEISTSLRHELSQLRVMGEVPRIVFCKDKHWSKVYEVEELLKKADFGEDYEPLSIGTHFKNDDRNIYSTEEQQLIKEEPEEELPEMSQNTLNLRHDFILSKIQRGMERSKAVHRQFPNFITEESESDTSNASLMSLKERKEGFENFLLQRRILRERTLKNGRKYTPEIILYKDDDENSLFNQYMNELDKYEDEFDYLEEENEDNK